MSGTPVWGPMHRSVACTVIDFFLAILINGYSLEANECLLVLRGKAGRFHFGRRHCKADNKGCKNASSVESGEQILSWTKCLVSPVPGKSREGKRGVLGWWLCDSSTASLSSFCLFCEHMFCERGKETKHLIDCYGSKCIRAKCTASK